MALHYISKIQLLVDEQLSTEKEINMFEKVYENYKSSSLVRKTLCRLKNCLTQYEKRGIGKGNYNKE